LKRLEGQFEYRPRTLVWNIFKGELDLMSDSGHGKLKFDRLLIAAGAFDRVIPFPGWTLPGVYTLGGAQIALKAQGVAIGRRVALVGAGPLLPLVASQYLKAGGQIAAVIDVTPRAAKFWALGQMLAMPAMVRRGLSYLRTIRSHGVPSIYGARGIRVEGREAVEGISWRTASGQWVRMECDAVGASFGLRSETQLADVAGCEFTFDATLRQWLPKRTEGGRTTIDSVYLAGDCAGIGGADVAELSGERAALAIQEDLGMSINGSRRVEIERRLRRFARFRDGLERAYPFPHHLLEDLGEATTVCRCEGVDLQALRQVYERTEPPEVNRQKAFSRVGLGRCQGRVCGLAAAELLARFSGRSVESAGRMRSQPPIKPIAIQS
jgi:NADPH-dependent 2,4-dienoyl-CoA reductase/sulfur reductase-like enzyme